MKEFIDINKLWKEMRKERVAHWLDKITFLRLLLLWITIIVIFGTLYHLFSTADSYLYYNPDSVPVDEAKDAVYFSFVASTTAGFGDIIPVGQFKILAIIEIVFGVILLALLTSKIVSIKQDAILNEIYELSLNEKVNRIRSALLLFRQNLSRLLTKHEEGLLKKREISDIYIYIAQFEDTLNEIHTLMNRPKNNGYTKGLDPVNAELVFNSILNSFEKMQEMIDSLKKDKIEWKRDIACNLISKCIGITDEIFDKLTKSKLLQEKALEDFKLRKQALMKEIKKEIASDGKESR